MKKTLYLLSILFSLGFFNSFKAQTPYFQQRVDYRIDVQLDDVSHTLNCKAKYLYTNNSPDTLREIWFHVWANAYGDRRSTFQKEMTNYENLNLWFPDQNKTGYISGLDFKVDEKELSWSFDIKNPDICLVRLPKALLPGDSIEIMSPFILKIPSSEFSRMGHNGNDYQLTQWYPKPAVYDRQGWHPIPYMSKGEFYSEFGKYTVSITLPSNYVVASTGRCLTESEEAFIDQRANISENYYYNKNTESSKTLKTLVFEQDSIHDFAWFASKEYKVLKSKVRLPQSGRIVELRSYYHPSADPVWRNSINYLRDAVLYYSNRVGEYPYPIMSAVYSSKNGSSSMEYPTIVNITTYGPAQALDWVITHEVGHNWFYGILASNERTNPWMDEGINSYYDFCYTQNKYPNYTLMGDALFALTKYPFKYAPAFERLSVNLMLSRNNNDQACNLTAPEYDPDNYTGSVYWKTGALFRLLESYLGQEKFDNAMKSYYDTWKFKHPQPDDIQSVLEAKTGNNLNWFFGPLLSTTDKMDFSIRKVVTDSAKQITRVEVRNHTRLNAPFCLSFYKDDLFLKKEWFGPTDKKNYSVGVSVFADKVILDENLEMPEIKRSHQIYDSRKTWSYCRPVKFKFGGGFENPEKSEIYWAPAAGWNYYDKWMLGLSLYNAFPITRKDEFLLMPLYSISNNKLSGVFDYKHHIKPRFAQNLSLGIFVKSFSYAQVPQILDYTLVKPSVDLMFRKNNKRFIEKNLKLEYFYLMKDQIRSVTKTEKQIATSDKSFLVLTYRNQNNRILNPYHYQCRIESNENFVKASAEINHTFHYKQNKTLNVRVFGGAFLWQTKDFYGNYNLRMSGTNGYHDYLMQDWYLGRTESSGIAAHQMMHKDGDFKMYTFVGDNNKWLTTVNVETNLPGLIPFKIFLDLGTYYRAKTAFTGSTTIPYVLGIKQGFIKDAIEIYFPLAFSSDLKQVSDLYNQKFLDHISIYINLEKLNYVRMLKKGGLF